MSEQFCLRVGNNIKKYRKETDITLKQLAEKVDLTEATIQKYEAGKIKSIDSELLKKIADALGVEPQKLTGWESRESRLQYKEEKRGEDEARLVKKYSQLSNANKKAVRNLIDNLLDAQSK